MKYVMKKTATLIITLFVVSFLTFLAFAVIPGDPALSALGTQATEEQLSQLREEMGLNDPLPLRYGKWMTAFLQGDMGKSYSYSLPVTEMVGDKIPITLVITGISFILVLLIAIPAGLLMVRFGHKKWIGLLESVNQTLMAVPPFFLGMMLTLVFGLILRWFTPGGYVSCSENPAGFLQYIFWPSLALALSKCTMAARMLKSSLYTQLDMDYVRTARSRGNSTGRILSVHMLRNAMIPVVTFLAVVLADIVAQSIIIEQVFSIPGLGRLLITSIGTRDYPVVQAIVVLIAGFVMLTNFIADLIYRRLDPRIKIT